MDNEKLLELKKFKYGTAESFLLWAYQKTDLHKNRIIELIEEKFGLPKKESQNLYSKYINSSDDKIRNESIRKDFLQNEVEQYLKSIFEKTDMSLKNIFKVTSEKYSISKAEAERVLRSNYTSEEILQRSKNNFKKNYSSSYAPMAKIDSIANSHLKSIMNEV